MPTIDRIKLTGLPRLAQQEDFRRVVLLCCLLFLALQILYIVRLPLVMDEFQHASSIYRLAEQTPYRDFAPYKTVLGYYIQLPVLRLASRPWSALLAVKIEMAVVLTVTLALATLTLGRYLNRRAVLLALGMLFLMSTFAERAAELRVDMLTAVAGLASLVLLLTRRYFLAGLACGASLLISQKGAFYVLSANAALALVWLVADRSLRQVRRLIAFNIAVGACLLGYIGLWAVISTWDAVIQATFFSHSTIAFGQLYDNQLKYWAQTLSRNPLFYLLAVLGLRPLLQRAYPALDEGRQILLATYGGTLILLSLLHRQPWPYFFVLLIPTLWVLVAAYFDHEIRHWSHRPTWYRRVAVMTLVGLGFLLPLTRVPVVLARDSGYQRSMIRLADRLLEDGESYLAGTELLFDRPQEIRRLSWLDIPRARALAETPIYELEQLRRDLESSSTKIVVNNYRLHRLPRILRRHLARSYLPLWGSIDIYAPTLEPGRHTLEIRFPGDYELLTPTEQAVTIEGNEHRAGDRLFLDQRSYDVVTPAAARLRYIPPDVGDYLDPAYQVPKRFFPDIYTY